jgi:hypothetical protein
MQRIEEIFPTQARNAPRFVPGFSEFPGDLISA